MLENYSVLVTGADGFIGSWLCKALVERKAKVIGTVLSLNKLNPLLESIENKVELLQADVTKKEEIEKAFEGREIDCCVHLAAITDTACVEDECLEGVNVCGTENVLSACKENGVNGFVFSSTMRVCDESKCTEYAKSKLKAEGIVKRFCEENELGALIFRQTNVFGAFDFNTARIVPNTILRFLRGVEPEIRSDPCVVRDLLYVKDAVDLYLKGIEYLKNHKAVETVNAVSGHSFTLKEIIEVTAELMGERFKLKKECGAVASGDLDNTAKALLGWKPIYGFREALKETVEHYKTNQGLYQS